jgi:Family of unknown function (DUF6134)
MLSTFGVSLCRLAASAVAVSFFASALPASSFAAGTFEKRTYEVRTDGKPSGHYVIKLTDKPDGVDVVEDCQVDTKLLLIHYQYIYHAREVWNAHRLVSFDSKRDDNFKHCILSVQPAADKLQLTVNGKPARTIDGDIITSSYWFLPNPGSENFTRTYLEIDTGRIYGAHLVLIGTEPIQVGDQKLTCKHYKLTGGDQEDLWYDEQDRLVRQSEIDAGHRTIIQLQSITHG